jgi:hypothetical protein
MSRFPLAGSELLDVGDSPCIPDGFGKDVDMEYPSHSLMPAMR